MSFLNIPPALKVPLPQNLFLPPPDRQQGTSVHLVLVLVLDSSTFEWSSCASHFTPAALQPLHWSLKTELRSSVCLHSTHISTTTSRS